MSPEPMRLTVISDYICPWCYIVTTRVARMEAEYLVEVVWWPFELHPETPKEGVRVEALIARRGEAYEAHRRRLKEYAAEVGVQLASNRVVANSHRALELAEFARGRGCFKQVHDALFRAYFVEAQDIGDPAVLLGIAAGAGLDPAEFERSMARGEFAGLVDRATAEARQRGFTSTPTIIFGDRTFVPGAQDWDVYENVLTRLGVPRRGPTTTA
jgi:predicted DsbA family dithiol-disulfide isomerase